MKQQRMGSVAALVTAACCALAMASSHREAPGITSMPKVDATDFYMFNSYETGREGYVTIVANYQPFQTPYGGPNFFQMDPDAVYEINIDNDGDARPDVVFSFRFNNVSKDLSIPVGNANVPVALYNLGMIGPAASATGALNITESYNVSVSYEDSRGRKRSALARDPASNSVSFRKPADHVGNKTFGDYEAYARNHISTFTLPGSDLTGRVFVGQRKDPFIVNLGEAFDLVNLNPVGAPDAKADTLADDNVTSIIIEVPASYLRKGTEKVIGGWTSASLPQSRALRRVASFDTPSFGTGPAVQVSRLGMPLVNELVIGVRDKNKFNGSLPKDDAQFLTYVTNPTLPEILKILFGVTPPCLPRNDLVAIFLTGLDGLNKPANVRPAEMLRLNTDTVAIPVKPKGMQNRLGVLGGDLQGFPNGRRPGDDVVDIALRAVMGAAIPDAGQTGGCAPSGALPYTDGALCNDSFFDDSFPYLRTPISASPNTGG